jgi:hypothetical protein
VHRRVAIPALLLAWLCANGAFWDLTQVFAWSRMFAGYAQTLGVAAALRETFDPAKPCDLCRVVQKARSDDEAQRPASAPADAARFDLIHEPAGEPIAAGATRFAAWPTVIDHQLPSRVDPVPLPPPRA